MPLQHPMLLLAGEACHMTTFVVVSNRTETVPTKTGDIREAPALCQDICDLALAYSLCLVGTTLGASYAVTPGSERSSPGPYTEGLPSSC